MNLIDSSKWETYVKEPENVTITINNDDIVIEKSVNNAAILRQFLDFTIEEGKFYKFSLVVEDYDCSSSIAPYAMISQFDAEEKILMRLYAENKIENPAIKELIFMPEKKSKKLKVEIGLKGTGKAVFKDFSFKEVDAPKERKARVVTTRIECEPDMKLNMEKIELTLNKAGKLNPDLILFTEKLVDAKSGRPVEETAETTEGAYCTLAKKYAKKYNTYIIINLNLKDENERIYVASVLIDRKGEIAGIYKKTHLTYGEYERGITAGEEYPVFETDFGKLGMLICWDALFPEPARILALKGAEIIAISTAAKPHNRHNARAIENGVYVIVSGSGHPRGTVDVNLFNSKIISPIGRLLGAAHDDMEIALAEIDFNEKPIVPGLSVRTGAQPHNIYMNERHPELYEEIYR